ncbi:MAG: PIN domain-containing protein [Actinobacteria bacterium]|nr:PIN domain-containing protein [Actinomycetota bacterium]
MRLLLDTSVIIRYVTGEPVWAAEQARGLFAAAAAGRLELVVADVAFIETGFVLWRVLRLERSAVVAYLDSLLQAPGVLPEHRELLQKCLELFQRHPIGLVDTYLAAGAMAAGVDGVASLDRGFDRVPGVRRVESADDVG